MFPPYDHDGDDVGISPVSPDHNELWNVSTEGTSPRRSPGEAFHPCPAGKGRPPTPPPQECLDVVQEEPDEGWSRCFLVRPQSRPSYSHSTVPLVTSHKPPTSKLLLSLSICRLPWEFRDRIHLLESNRIFQEASNPLQSSSDQ